MLASVPTSAAADPQSLACPNKQTVTLSGSGAPPNEGLLVYLRTRGVGGGSSDAAGSWRIPLRLNERPGIYAVEVRLRSNRALIARFTCYVDVPLDITETPTPEASATSLPTPEASATSRPARPTPTRTATGATVTTTPTSGTPTATTTGATATSGTTTATPTGTRTSATATSTSAASTSAVKINDVVCRKPTDEPYTEYIELRNESRSRVNIGNWKIINTSRPNISYTFPDYSIDPGPDVYIVVYSDSDTDSPSSGEFYWGRSDQLWLNGNKAELRDNNNILISQFNVTCSS